tara:strand:+ start:203 stop:520 length:318 start_codon:yes stop_codon:yes gene_type:complete
MSEVKTEVIFNNGKNADNGYLIKNPYATVQKIDTDLVEAGFVEIPVFQLLHILNFLYVGAKRDSKKSFFTSKATRALNKWFETKQTYKFWRKNLKPLKDHYCPDL